MKIVYDVPLNVMDIKEKLEKACFRIYETNKNETILIYKKNQQFFMEIDTGRRSTRYKLVITDTYIQLKYSGFFSYMNIILAVFWTFLPLVLSVLLVIAMLVDKELEEIPKIMAVIPISMGFLWFLLIEHRIMAKRFIKKLLNINDD